jgi:hypothetical protein
MRVGASILGFVLCLPVLPATLEKLTLEQMTQQATMIVRGKITACSGEARGRIIYTRCGLAVSETWKGTARSQVDFLIPGGTLRTLTQTFTGTPKFSTDEQYVLFLWVGKSGIPQVIGLSQGVFDVSSAPSGDSVRRAASTETMVDSTGKQVRDEEIRMSVGELHARVNRALGIDTQRGAGK